MVKKLILIFCILLYPLTNVALSAEAVNVEYIHTAIKQKWDIDIPYNPDLKTPGITANMEYLLTMVDIANKRLNGVATTNYRNSEYATQAVADTVAANDVITRLIEIVPEPKFYITTTWTSSFGFNISAMGEFVINWDNEKLENVSRTDTNETSYSHNFSKAGNHLITISGHATGYSTNPTTAAISFAYNTKIQKIEGSLGAIFSTIKNDNGSIQQPRFYRTFQNSSNITGQIPTDLFTGVKGPPVSSMFQNTFNGCAKLTGEIPKKLFSGLRGAPASNMFGYTFNGCSGLTSIEEGIFDGIQGHPDTYMFYGTFSMCTGLESIPDKLFDGIKGNPASNMFRSTFLGCSSLTSIPEKLFGGIYGPPMHYMFDTTFAGCTNLTSIPENLFGDISGGAATNMFYQTFYNCTSLSGASAKINHKPLYEIWPNTSGNQSSGCYYNTTGLSDYDQIPANWK